MKKLLCILLTMLMLIPFAAAESHYESVTLAFEDGFSLSVPSDWVSFPLTEEQQASGFIYCLGSADAARLMYIQRWNTDYASLADLQSDMEQRPEIVLRSSNESFLMYNFSSGDCSGCMTLLNGDVLNLLFLPQSDPENMLIAATIATTFKTEF